MPLPTEKTSPKNDLGAYIILIYAPPKWGKTWFASKFEDALFFATEEGHNEVEIYKSTILTWTDFLADCKELAAGKHNFKTIVIDTIDNLYKMCSEYMCAKLEIKHESDLGYGKGFVMVNNEFHRILTKLSLLPYGLIMLSHSQEKEVETRTGKIKKIVPTLPEAARKIVMGMTDIILYGDFEVIRDKDGKIKEYNRVFRTRATMHYEAGSRIPHLPEVIELDYDAFISAFKKAKNLS